MTLLSRNGEDFKKPLMKGYLDPAVPNWTFEEFRSQAKWAVEREIEITGFGVINGEMSSHRHVLDFDKGEFLEPVREKVLADTGFDLFTLPRVRSGRTSSKGYHLILRSTASVPKQKLAMTKAGEKFAVAVELMGTGSQCVSEGSRHRSGNLYVIEHGDPVNPPVIDFDLFQRILASVRTFDELKDVVPERRQPAPLPLPRQYTADPGTSSVDIIHRYGDENDLHDVLTRYGYEHTGGSFYRHPNNGETDHSVNVLDRRSFHFSPNDPMARHGNPCRNGAGVWADAFDLYAGYEHGGDRKAAIRALSKLWGLGGEKPKMARGEVIDWKGDVGFPVDPIPEQPTSATKAARDGIVFRKISDVEERDVEWLWPNRIAVGKLTILAGDPGLGKSFLTMDIAARITRGDHFPDNAIEGGCFVYQERPKPADVILLSAEDDPSDTLRPRLRKNGAVLDRVSILEAKTVRGQRKMITMDDIPSIEEALKRTPNAKLIVIDPVGAYVGDADSHNDAEVRGLLHPLKDLAEKYRVAILLVAHLNKSSGGKGGAGTKAIYRIMGSLGFIGTCRTGHTLTLDPNDKERKVFIPIKNNIGPLNYALGYRIVDGCLVWEKQPITLEDADAMLDASPEKSSPERKNAEEFLMSELEGGPKSAKLVKENAQASFITSATLRRAAAKLGIKSKKGGFKDGWLWAQPSHEWDDED